MRSLSRAATALGLLGIGLAMVAGALLGVRPRADASAPGVSKVRVRDPLLSAGPPERARESVGGFTGFGGAALAGEVIAGGVLVSVEPNENGGGTLVFRDGGRETTIRYRDTTRLRELVAGAVLAPDDTVLLRFEDGDVVSVLRIPPLPAAEEDAGDG